MVDVPEWVTKEVGPLPVWGWAVAGVGGVFIGRMVAKRFGGSSSSDEEPPAAGDASASAGYMGGGLPLQGGYGAPGIGGTIVSYSNAGTGQTPDAGYASNEAWRIAVINTLKGAGRNPVAVDQALTTWLNGLALPPEQESIVNEAIAKLGFPPNPPTQTPRYMPPEPPPATVTPPATPTTPTRTVRPPGYLVSHDGNTVFWTDYEVVQWVRDGNESIRLWRNGAVDDKARREANGITAYPVPLPIPLQNIIAMQHVGGPPPGWSAADWQ